MKLDAKYWENRYLNEETGWDLGQVSAPIKNYVDQIADTDISVLVPGAGYGYEVLYLRKKGISNVTVVDIAQTPLKRLHQRLGDQQGYELIQQDFFSHSGSYDLILEQTFFCALEVRFRESYTQKMYELLKPGGILAGVLFDFTQQRDAPPYGGSIEEYQELFAPKFDISRIESCRCSEPDRQGKELFIELIKPVYEK
ncbi:methyltransferase domain-containing protein [Nonlabens xiamenensis]|uniref:methyltransferase domain-containing protein n=1 Tax=Nonlabens xiamenensis TaxID=2341043 RepID=UPI000F60A974|nr:methyltransferase domain-containing protein [Nonlabens xiamenensis]